MDATETALPGVPQVAAFDTAFHATIPDAAAVYPLPWEWTQRWGLRRFGFHGLSVQYAVRRSRELLGAVPLRMIVCHLGAGCSVTAVLDGRSIDTSMGFTPLEGLMMARRSGSVDPGLLIYLLEHAGLALATWTADSTKTRAWPGSRVYRATGAPSRQPQRQATSARSSRAAMFLHRLVAAVGALAATLGGLDALVFTGGIGENSAEVRQAVAAGLSFAGVRLAPEALAQGDRDVAATSSSARVLVIARP